MTLRSYIAVAAETWRGGAIRRTYQRTMTDEVFGGYSSRCEVGIAESSGGFLVLGSGETWADAFADARRAPSGATPPEGPRDGR